MIVHSICRDAKSRKYIFSRADQKPDRHAPGVYEKVIETEVKSKRHLPYTLKGDEVFIYFNPATSKFWFKGKELASKPASQVSAQPSIEDEPVASSSQGSNRNRLQKQSATVSDQQSITWKLSNCTTIASKADVMKAQVGSFDFCVDDPDDWLKNFEKAVRDCCSNVDETEDYYYAYMPYFLEDETLKWFFDSRSSGKETSWSEFKKKFSKHFWSMHWQFAEEAINYDVDDDVSLFEFTSDKIKNLKRLFPTMETKTIIKICILALPEEHRERLQEGVNFSVELFLNLVEAIDRQIGKFPNKSVPAERNQADQSDDETAPVRRSNMDAASISSIIDEKFDKIHENNLKEINDVIANALSADKLKSLLTTVLLQINKSS